MIDREADLDRIGKRQGRRGGFARAAASSVLASVAAPNGTTPTVQALSAPNIGASTRLIASWKVEAVPISGMNCFGIDSRDSGHTRVPAPPHMMTGRTFLAILTSTIRRRPLAALQL